MLPTSTPVLAAEHPDPPDDVDRARLSRTHHDAVEVDRVVDDIEAFGDALPAPAPVQAAEEPADLHARVDLGGVARVDRDGGDALGLRIWAHRDVGKRHAERQRPPDPAAVRRSIDRRGLVPREHRVGVARMQEERPDGETGGRGVEPDPMGAVILAPVDARLRPGEHRGRARRVNRDRPHLGGRREPVADRLPRRLAALASVEATLHGVAESRVPGQAHVDEGSRGGHRSLLHGPARGRSSPRPPGRQRLKPAPRARPRRR